MQKQKRKKKTGRKTLRKSTLPINSILKVLGLDSIAETTYPAFSWSG